MPPASFAFPLLFAALNAAPRRDAKMGYAGSQTVSAGRGYAFRGGSRVSTVSRFGAISRNTSERPSPVRTICSGFGRVSEFSTMGFLEPH
jgi:hypothetical protein